MLPPLPGSAAKVEEYLDEIDRRGGRAKRMDFYRIAGSETNLNRWIKFLMDDCKFIKKEIKEDRIYYQKTERGQFIHDVYKNHRYLLQISTYSLSKHKLKRWRP